MPCKAQPRAGCSFGQPSHAPYLPAGLGAKRARTSPSASPTGPIVRPSALPPSLACNAKPFLASGKRRPAAHRWRRLATQAARQPLVTEEGEQAQQEQAVSSSQRAAAQQPHSAAAAQQHESAAAAAEAARAHSAGGGGGHHHQPAPDTSPLPKLLLLGTALLWGRCAWFYITCTSCCSPWAAVYLPAAGLISTTHMCFPCPPRSYAPSLRFVYTAPSPPDPVVVMAIRGVLQVLPYCPSRCSLAVQTW